MALSPRHATLLSETLGGEELVRTCYRQANGGPGWERALSEIIQETEPVRTGFCTTVLRARALRSGRLCASCFTSRMTLGQVSHILRLGFPTCKMGLIIVSTFIRKAFSREH